MTDNSSNHIRKLAPLAPLGLTGSIILRNNKTILILIHLLLPLIVVLYLNVLSINPSIASPYILSLSPVKLISIGPLKDWNNLLPLTGNTREQSWQLGECQGLLLTALQTANTKALNTAISYTESTITNITSINRSKPLVIVTTSNINERASSLLRLIQTVKDNTIKDENGKGLMKYMYRMFNLINVIWLISIIGITISIGPFCVSMFTSIVVMVGNIVLKIWRNILSHVWRPLLYILVMLTYGTLCDKDISHNIKVYTSLSVTVIFYITVVYTLKQLVDVKALQSNDDHTSLILLGFLLFLPQAILTGSYLFGFGTVVWLYLFLGFGMMSIWGGYAIGFVGDDQLIRCSISSVYLLSIHISCIVSGVGHDYLAPFNSGLQCLGGTSLYIALLIKSSCYYSDRRKFVIMYLLALLSGIIIGNLVPLLALRNTAYVFIYLFILDSVSFYCSRQNVSAAVLVTSVLLYIGCLLLNKYPEVIVSIYSG